MLSISSSFNNLSLKRSREITGSKSICRVKGGNPFLVDNSAAFYILLEMVQ
jgi:hypothetical protein